MDKEQLLQLKEEIQKQRSLPYLSKVLELEETEVLGLVHRLKEQKYNISTMRKNNIIYIKDFGDAGLEIAQPFYLSTNKKEVKIGIVSDTRLCSIYQQLSILNDIYKKAFEYGVTDMFHCGDISEGIYSGKSELYNESLFLHGEYEQGRYIAENYPYVKSITTHFITGDHDYSHVKLDKRDIGKSISVVREDMNYLGKLRKRIIVTNLDGKELFNILMVHPKGRIPYTISYKPQQFISAMRSEDKPNLLFHGQWLQTEKLEFQGVREYSSPSVVATTPEMIDNIYQNTIGSWFMTIYLDDKGNISRIKPLFNPYYKTIDQDYKKAKVLRLGD